MILDKNHQLFLAPMSGITDTSFRLLMRELGADVVMSELLSAESIVNSHKRTLSMLRLNKNESPVGIQLFGSDPHIIKKAAIICQDYGAEFIDINMGCPKKKINKKKSGAALLKDPEYLNEFLSIANNDLPLPLSIKIRTGWDIKNADQTIQIAFDNNVAFVSIHGRTQAQGYEGNNDWNYINEIAQNSKLPIIGNGDITEAKRAIDLLENSHCHGIMIGRGVLLNPLLFLEIKEKQMGLKIEVDLFGIINRYYEIVIEELDQKNQGIKLAKLFYWFSLPYENSNNFKADIFQLRESPKKVLEYSIRFFETNQLLEKQKNQDFLMGGHG